MLIRFILVLLVCMWSRSHCLDPSSWAELGLSDGLCRYGNSVECCWGWRQTDGGRCQPHCQQGCKHGDCVGPDRCRCYPGYTGKACNHDLNECGVNPRPCKHRCMNTPGSYKCFCQDGYTPHLDGSCRNARTCYHANCQYGCEVTKGAVRCTCPSPGLRLGPDRRTCVDVDECVSGGGVCPRRRKCVNTFGSFLCKCHLGFKLTLTGGRYSCIDKDSRPFCSLNPSSPNCRCKDGRCSALLKVKVEPQRPRSKSTTPAKTMTTNSNTRPTTTTSITTNPTTSSSRSSTTTTRPTSTTIPTTTSRATTTSRPTTTSSATRPTLTRPITTRLYTTIPITTTTRHYTTIPNTNTTRPYTTIPNTATISTTNTSRGTPAPTVTITAGTDTSAASINASITASITTSSTPTMAPSMTSSSLVSTNTIKEEVIHRQRGDVHIPRQPGRHQVLDFDVELGTTAEDAGDDPNVGELRCTFDQGLCDWTSEEEGDLHWETPPSPAGGRYLSVQELKAGQKSIRGARLAIQTVPQWSHGDLCFSFSHWLSGHHVGVLQLFVKRREQRSSSALWGRTGGHGWRRTQVTVTMHPRDKVLLRAERRKGRTGPIAVDDVTVKRGTC
ncbi:nephronectin-like [Antennarius striatus]|uniref:nephronectin-like n=1 Tax=Antennarius striatus TaxID=241820 RepID=UPI0035AD8D04